MPANRSSGAASLLETLGVPRERVLYVQSSVDWIERAGYAASDVLSTLFEWTGTAGTLAMPSYPFRSTHLAYLETRPPFDVLRTPAAIGLLPEVFRRSKGVLRSLDPDFCVCAYGPDAGAIVGARPAEPDPFGMDSSYERMLDRRAVVLGLGVSLNSSSFIHLVDSRAEAGYPAPVFMDGVFSLTVVDATGRSRDVLRKSLRPEFQQLTRPAAVVTAMHPTESAFAAVEINGATFFRWDLVSWVSWCLAHARQQAATGEWPCWLTRLGHRGP